LYIDEYLNGKSDEERQQFYEKPVDKQYSTIMAWKRRRDLAGSNTNVSSVAAMTEALRKVKKAIPSLDSLSPKDADRLRTALHEIYYDIDNFDKIKKGQLLRELESEKEKIVKQTESLDRKIEALRQELS
ncbi:MAG: hypothetical protein K2I16_12500, partial [Muribaculaceae bacterium]|nr:hypothetical protein [Muribaculaceae bacterium]